MNKHVRRSKNDKATLAVPSKVSDPAADSVQQVVAEVRVPAEIAADGLSMPVATRAAAAVDLVAKAARVAVETKVDVVAVARVIKTVASRTPDLLWLRVRSLPSL